MTLIVALYVVPLLVSALSAVCRSAAVNHALTLLAGVAHLTAAVSCLVLRWDPFPEGNWLAVDSLAALFLTILSHTFVLAALYSRGFLERMQGPAAERSKRLFYPALNFYLVANTLVLTVQHFALLWVVLELTTFSLVPLLYFYRSKESFEAVWKYLFLVSLGLVFLFIGVLFLGLSARALVASDALLMRPLREAGTQLDPLWLKASFVFALVGLSAKIGLAPMHPGDVDATANAPAPVAALMSGSLRSTGVAALLRFCQVVAPTEVNAFAQRLLILAGLLSLAVAAVFMWRNRNYKRLLAYSSVEHLGIVALGIGTGGIALLGALLHLVFNSLGKAALFFTAGNIHHRYGSREIGAVSGLMRHMPWSGAVWTLAFLFVVGTPPFGTFFSEIYVLLGLVRAKSWLPLTLFLILLMIVFIGTSRAMLGMLQVPGTVPQAAGETKERLQLSHVLCLYALAASVPLALLQPAGLFGPLHDIAATLGVKL